MKLLLGAFIAGVLVVSVAHRSAGQVSNSVLVLDGTDDLIETEFDLAGAPKDNFSIEVWVKPSALINLPDQGGAGSKNHGCIIYPEPGRSIAKFEGHKNAGVGLSVGRNGVVVFEQPKIYGGPYHQKVALLVHRASIEQWTHVAVVFTGRQPVLYLDGTFAARGIKSTRVLWLLARQIGGNRDNFGNYAGMMDDLCLWNRALSFEEIKQHAERQDRKNEAGLILYYSFDQVDGDGTFPDLSYKGHKGMLMNGISIAEGTFTETPSIAETTEVAADVDKDIPTTGVSNGDAIAVVIGNQDYQSKDIPDVTFALRDAQTVRQYLKKVLGYKEGNILYFENASGTAFRKLFGTPQYPKGRLAQLVKPGKSDVFIYYSGHGAPDIQEGQGYFLPVDCAPDDVRLVGYPLDLLYKNLAEIEARSMVIVVDACFSGGSNDGMLIQSASPIGIQVNNPMASVKNAAVFTSSSGDQISSWYPQQRHGLFTYFFLKALRGAADTDGNGTITAREIFDYIADPTEGVPYWARTLHSGRVQEPAFQGNPDIHVTGK